MIGIFGATGFIGSHLARRLVGAEEGLRLVSRRMEANFLAEFGDSCECVEANILEPLDISPALNGVKTVVQLISSSSPGLENKHLVSDIRNNIIPQVEFIQSCVAAGVDRFVFISSGGTVYGPAAPVPTPEDAQCTPINSYGVTKLTVENYLRLYGMLEKIGCVILRVSNPFGPGQRFRRGQGLIPAILDRYRRNQPIQIFGDGSARRDYLYIDDLVDAIQKAIDMPGEVNFTLNIGQGESRSISEVVGAIERASGHIFEKEYLPGRPTDVKESCLDISKANAVLDWTPKTAFQDAINLTVKAEFVN
ncbi:MAG: NAD-dependent epimerase/dehydratase family protein [Rhizobiaceae bacterium]